MRKIIFYIVISLFFSSCISQKKITKRFGNVNGILSNTLNIEEKKTESKYSTRLLKIFYEEINKYPTKKISTAFFLTDGQIHDLKDKHLDI